MKGLHGGDGILADARIVKTSQGSFYKTLPRPYSGIQDCLEESWEGI